MMTAAAMRSATAAMRSAATAMRSTHREVPSASALGRAYPEVPFAAVRSAYRKMPSAAMRSAATAMRSTPMRREPAMRSPSAMGCRSAVER